MSKKPSLYDLFNDDSLWGNQTAGDLSHEEMLQINWNKKTPNSVKTLLKEKSKQAWKNKTKEDADQWRNNLRTANIKAQKDRRLYVMTPEGIMHGMSQTCEYYKITTGSLRDRMHYNPTEYYYCDVNGNKIDSNRKFADSTNYKIAAQQRKKAVHTPAGNFDSIKDACNYYNLTAATIREKLKSSKSIHDEWYYIDNK